MGDVDIKKIFSKNFNRLMGLNNKSQKDICDDLGYHRATVSEWSRGNKYPRMDKVEKLAQYFHVQISELIDDLPTSENTLIKLSKKDTNPNIQNKLSDILSELRPESGITLKNGEKTMTDSEKEILRISVENIIRLAQQMEK